MDFNPRLNQAQFLGVDFSLQHFAFGDGKNGFFTYNQKYLRLL